MINNIIVVVTRNPGGIYASYDEGATFTQVVTNALTNEVHDISINEVNPYITVFTYGDGEATTPYYSTNLGATYDPGQNTFGKEVTYVGNNSFVFGGLNAATGQGSKLGISLDNGQTIDSTVDVTSLFNYPGAVYNNITVTGFDFVNYAGGYITIAGDQNNSAADQILTRTYDMGQSFPDALILPGSMGIIRAVWVSPDRNIVFAIGDPDSIRGSLYSINPSLTEAPVPVLLGGVMVGSVTNNLTVKFASVPGFYDPDPAQPVIPRIPERSKVYFLDSAGNIYYSSDYGFTWQFRSRIQAQCVDLIVISENILLVLSKSPSAVYKSVDGGLTFTQNLQPSWTNPKGITQTEALKCERCPTIFETDINGIPYKCQRNLYVGPLCKSPYIYSELYESCAKPSTIEPTNLVLSIDYSGSVDGAEIALFRGYLQVLLSKIEDRLLDGSMRVCIIGWSAEICILQDFTSDLSLLQQAVESTPPGRCSEEGTNQTGQFCVSIRKLYDESLLRPDAENVLVVLTDGSHAMGQEITTCDLSDIGIQPVATTNFSGSLATNMYSLIKNAKEGLNEGRGMKIMAVVLGELYERVLVETEYIKDPETRFGSAFVVPTKVPGRSNYFYFDGGTYDTAGFIADQIRLGLAAEIISSPTCPDGTIGRAGYDSLGYCNANESFRTLSCTAIFTDCTGQIPPFEAQGDFIFSAYGKIVRLRPGNVDIYYEGCFLVEPPITVNPNPSTVPIVSIDNENVFNADQCDLCLSLTYYKLTNCGIPQNGLPPILYSGDSALGQYITDGTPVVTNRYWVGCYLIEPIAALPDGGQIAFDFVVNITSALTACTECLGPDPDPIINYKLTELCVDPTSIIYCESATNDLQSYVGQYVNIQGFGTRCWLVETDTDVQAIYQDVVVTQSYPDCTACIPVTSYVFTNCENDTIVINTRQDFSQYVGQTVTLQEYPGNCWVCTDVSSALPNPQLVTLSGPPYLDCPSCLVRYYQLTNCANPDVYLISSSSNLLPYLGRVITAAGFPGLCFTVSDPKCDCIKVTVDGVDYNVNAEPNLFNGRKNYRFTTEGGAELAIAWNTNPNRWEMFNQNTLEVYGFNTADSDCPFANLWTIIQGSSYIISRVTFCPNDIYAISPELEFADCVPCIKCI